MEKLGRRFTLALFFAAKIKNKPTSNKMGGKLRSYSFARTSTPHRSKDIVCPALPCIVHSCIQYGILCYRCGSFSLYDTYIISLVYNPVYCRKIKINRRKIMMNTITRKTIFSKGKRKEFVLIVEAEEDADQQDQDPHSHSQRSKSRSWSLKKRIIGGSGSGSGSSTSLKENKKNNDDNDNVKMISKLRDSFRRKTSKKHKHIDRHGRDDNNDDDESKSSYVTTLLTTKAIIRVSPMNTSCEATLIDLTNDVTHDDMSDTTLSASDLQLLQDDDASSNSCSKIMPPLSSGYTTGGADDFTTNLNGTYGNNNNNNNEDIMDNVMDNDVGEDDVQQCHTRQPQQQQQQQQQQRNHSNFVINKDSELYESLFIASSSDEDGDDDDDNEIFNEYYNNKDIVDYDDDDVLPADDKLLNITIDTVELADDEEYEFDEFDENIFQSYEDGINFEEY